MQQNKLKKAQEKEKNEIERMKQGPAENMTIAVLKQLLKGKGITQELQIQGKNASNTDKRITKEKKNCTRKQEKSMSN